MDATQYIDERLNGEISWYDSKSSLNKNLHFVTRMTEIVCAAIIPLLAGLAKDARPLIAIAIGGLGAIVAIAAGLSSAMKFQENWIKFRTTSEALKKEKYLFQTGSQPYDKENPETLLVQRIESLVSQENISWAQNTLHSTRKEKTD